MKALVARRIGGIFLLLVVFLLPVACGDADGMGQALSDAYGPCLTERTEDGHFSAVFTESPFAARPEAERAVTARKIAEYVRDHDPHYKGIKDIRVAFQTKKETARGELKHIAATYVFTRAQLGEPDIPHDSM